MKIKSWRKLLILVLIISFTLGLIAILMGLGNGTVVKIVTVHGETRVSARDTCFYIMFKDCSEIYKNQKVMLIPFVAMIMALAGTAGLATLNILKKSNTKINQISIFVLAILYLISCVLMFCICPILGSSHITARTTKYIWTLGWGAATWGFVTVFAFGVMITSLLINYRIYKNKQEKLMKRNPK